MRILSLLLAALLGTSCVVPPSCIGRTFGPVRPIEHFATLTVFSEPIEGPLKRRYSTGVGMWERFERRASMTIDARGKMVVASGSWPERCPRIPPEDLVEASRSWQPLLDRMPMPHIGLQVMANPYTYEDDWRPDGPLVSLSFGSTSGKTVGLLWDARSRLPEELDTAVMGTLEMVCSNSRRAKRYLLRDLPRQVTSRLECR